MELTIKSIIYFRKVAELEHISKAAEELYISQAHLSRIIDSLEKEIGVPLFDRVGRGLKLNSCGKIYYEYSKKMIALVDEAYKVTRDEYIRKNSKLAIATNTGAYLPNLFYLLLKDKERYQFKQYSLSRKKLVQMLQENKSDFNIICPPSSSNDIERIILHKEPGVIIYPEGHWLSDYKTIPLHELVDEDFVGVNLGYGARDSIEIMYKEYDFKPHFVIETADTAMVKQYVSKGLGIAVVPETLMLSDPYYKDHYCRVEEELYGILSLEWMKDRNLDDYDIHFIDTTLKYFHELSSLVNTQTSENPKTYNEIQKEKQG